MKKIRKSVFETNSSSTHSMCVCPTDEFNQFVDGGMLYNYNEDQLIPLIVVQEEYKKDTGDQMIDPVKFKKWCKNRDYSNYDDFGYGEYETFDESYTSKSGDEITIFGFYGYNG